MCKENENKNLRLTFFCATFCVAFALIVQLAWQQRPCPLLLLLLLLCWLSLLFFANIVAIVAFFMTWKSACKKIDQKYLLCVRLHALVYVIVSVLGLLLCLILCLWQSFKLALAYIHTYICMYILRTDIVACSGCQTVELILATCSFVLAKVLTAFVMLTQHVSICVYMCFVCLPTCNKKSAQSTNYISVVIKGSDNTTNTLTEAVTCPQLHL